MPLLRLIAPAAEYLPHFQPAVLQLRLATAGAAVMSGDVRAPGGAQLQQLLERANGSGGRGTGTLAAQLHAQQQQQNQLQHGQLLQAGHAGMQGQDSFWDGAGRDAAGQPQGAHSCHVDATAVIGSEAQASAGDDAAAAPSDGEPYLPYAAIPTTAAGQGDVQRHAGWLLRHLALFAGRHVITVRVRASPRSTTRHARGSDCHRQCWLSRHDAEAELRKLHVLQSELAQQLAEAAGKSVLTAITSGAGPRPLQKSLRLRP